TPGASMERTYNVLKKLEQKMKQVSGVEGMTFSTGRSFFSGNGSNNGLAFLRLKPFKERARNKNESIEAITAQLYQLSAGIPEAKIVFFSPPSVPGFGSNAGFEMLLLDKSGGDINSLYEVSQNFINQ